MSIRIAHRSIARSVYRDVYRHIIDSPFDQGDPPVPVGAPEALNVQIDGGVMVGEELTGAYDYYSPDDRPETGTTYQWYRDGQPIAGATGSVYVLTVDDMDAMITFEVTPSDGVDTGKPVISAPVGPVTQILVMNRYNYVLETE